jgi:hypothetical protein
MEETSREVESDSGTGVVGLLVLVLEGLDADADDKVSEE